MSNFTRIDAFFLGFAVFVNGFEWRVGLVVMAYVALLPLADWINAKIKAVRAALAEKGE